MKPDFGDRAAVRGLTRQTSKPTSSRRRQIDKERVNHGQEDNPTKRNG